MPRLPLPPLLVPLAFETPLFTRFEDERDFPNEGWWGRKGVCRRCGLLMQDAEPSCSTGEFWHLAKPYQTRARRCVNHGKALETTDRDLVPFLRKARRRYFKRVGIRP